MLCYFSCPPVSGRTLEQNHAAQLFSQMNLKINPYCQCNVVDITVISILRLTSTLHLQCVLQQPAILTYFEHVVLWTGLQSLI